MEVSPGERAAGALSPAKLEALAAEFRRDGVVVLRSVIPDDELGLLRPRMLSDAAALAARRAQHTGSRSDSGRKGHIWLGPPRAGPWVRPCFVANAIIEQVARVLLGGERVALTAYAGQCALPGSSSIRWHVAAAGSTPPRRRRPRRAARGPLGPHRCTSTSTCWTCTRGTAPRRSTRGK